jgi:outer membrane protein TolC
VSVIAYLVSQKQLGWYIKSEQAARNAVDIANTQYDDGLVDFNTVVSNLLALRTQQDLLASSRGQVAVNLVGVFKALGGGWEIYAGRTVDQLIPNETKDIMRKRTKYWDGVLE